MFLSTVVFDYYQVLLKQLKVIIRASDEEKDEEDSTLMTFSNFYHGLRHSLQLQLSSSNYEDKNALDMVLRQAKYQLFRSYYHILISYHSKKENETLVQQLQYLFNPYELILNEHSIQIKDEQLTGVSLDSPRQSLSDMFPIASLYQVKSEERDHIVSTSVEDKKLDEKKPLYLRIYEYICMFLPILVWLPTYRKNLSNLKNDIIAGITVGVLVIPQGMAYSLIAGMPPVYGLYTVMIPALVYAFLGTSSQLAVGPTAVCALMLSTSLQQLTTRLEPGSSLYITFAIIFAFLGGLIQLLMGIFRLGFLVNFLSHPVLSGFTSAAAIIIAASQLGYFLGISIPKDHRLQITMLNVLKALPEIHFPTLALGLASLAFLHLVDHLHFKSDIKFTLFNKEFKIPKKLHLKWLPSSLILVLLGIISIAIVKKIGGYDPSNNEVYGIHIVGKVPSGISKPSFPSLVKLTWSDFRESVILVLPVIVMAFMESISTAKYYALRRGYEVDPNQELIAIGMCNLIGSLFKGFPSTGSLCRTSVNARTGAATPLAGFITGIVVLLTLVVLTPIFYYLPMPVLAALVMYSAIHIPDFESFYYTYKTKGRDCILLLLAFVGTLFIGIMEGVLLASLISLVLVVFLSSRPSFCRLTRIPGTTAYQEVVKNKAAKEIPGVLIARFDADMYFANVQYFKDTLKKFIEESEHKIFAVVLDCSSINEVDSTGVSTLEELKEAFEKQHIEFFFAQMKRSVQKVIKNGDIYQSMQEHCFVLLHDAVLHAESVVTTRRRLMELQQSKDQSEFSSYNVYDNII